MDEDDEFLYGPTEKKAKIDTNEEKDQSPIEINEPETASKIEDSGEESEYESDSDVEIIVNTKPSSEDNKSLQRLGSLKLTVASEHGTSSVTETANNAIHDTEKPHADINDGEMSTKVLSTSLQEQSEAEKKHIPQQNLQLPKVEIDYVAQFEGKSILDVDLESLEFKPWREPGATITDYFNYGFDEFTWTAYCSKQSTLRKEFNPEKVLSDMMGGNVMNPFTMGMGMGNDMMMPNLSKNDMSVTNGGMFPPFTHQTDMTSGSSSGFDHMGFVQQSQFPVIPSISSNNVNDMSMNQGQQEEMGNSVAFQPPTLEDQQQQQSKGYQGVNRTKDAHVNKPDREPKESDRDRSDRTDRRRREHGTRRPAQQQQQQQQHFR